MNCKNCGAPMRLVRERDYWKCDYCVSFHFPSPSADGVKRLGPRADRTCPACQGPLMVASLDGRRVEQCARCEGLLAPSGVFAAVVRARRALHDGPREPAPPLDPQEELRHVSCPICLGKMSTHPYLGGGGAVVDSCWDCAVVWLDRDDLTRSVRAP